ncbi:MAG: hypothetical protein A2342_04650 [Gallionellales bacterium RIFOXYB12_FULL_54_9]|nr:MAG: hypothetical protein A2342_04650 [Gallionellales bacterium RIFOXYB12_FULL_54_9]
MNQDANADIRNLFKKFGGETANYQEIQQTYVVEKAEHSWPIVEAMERSRPAAPIRKAVSARLSAAAPVGTGLFTASSVPVSELLFQSAPVSPLAAKPEPVAVKSAGLFSHLLPEALPVTPPAPQAVVKAASSPLHSLFGALKLAVDEPPAQMPQVVQNASLDAVFSRLLNPNQPVAPSVPDNSLRGLFGFLKK